MKYLLDTNAVSVWARRGSPALLQRLLAVSPADVAISSLVEMELRYGLALTPQFRHRDALLGLLGLLNILPFDSDDAAEAAQLRATLKLQGTPIGPYDALIAGVALAKRLTLVTRNTREFDRVPGLAVEDWEQA